MKNRNLSVYIILGLAAAAIVFFVVRLFPGGANNTPAVVLPPAPMDSGMIGSPEGLGNGLLTVEVTPETVQAAIRTIDPISDYSREITVRLYCQDGDRESKLFVRAKTGMLRVTEDSGGVTEDLLIIGDKLYIWYDSSKVFTGAAAEGAAERIQHMVSVDWLLALPMERIIDAGYVDFNSEPCIYVVFTTEELGYKETAYISVDTGLLIGGESYDGDHLVYKLSAEKPELSTPPDESFFVPSKK